MVSALVNDTNLAGKHNGGQIQKLESNKADQCRAVFAGCRCVHGLLPVPSFRRRESCMTTVWRTSAALLLAALVSVDSAPARATEGATAEFDAATGYRISRYRAPVPEEVPGAKRIFVDDVEKLVAEKRTVFLDVAAAVGGGVDPVTGRWRLVKSRQNIPGSHWLPDVGRGKLGSGLQHYFQSNLERLTNGDKSRAIVIYCVADCWMGWNAAKRAASYGYTTVYWYPEGTDGWRDWDGTLVPANPIAMNPVDVGKSIPKRLPKAPGTLSH